MHFKLVGPITDVERIATGYGLRERNRLWKAYGRGRWRKMKGFADIEFSNGTICHAEIHWYDAHGIGPKEYKIKRIVP